MAKSVTLFVFSGIIAAAVNSANASGSFVQSIVDARLPLKGTPSESQIQACMIAMADAWRVNGLEAASLKTYASCAGTLLSCPMAMLLEACEIGTGRNGVMQRVNAMLKPADSTKPRRGRPAGKGAGKTTAVAAVNSGAGADPIHPMIEVGIITQHVAHARTAMATCLKWQENGRGLSTAQVDEIKEHYAMIAAILGTLTAKPAK